MRIISAIDDSPDDDPAPPTLLGELLESCGPWRLPEPWAALGPAPAVSGVADPDRTLEELRRGHPDAMLLETHVAVTNSGGELALNPRLVGAENCLVPLTGGSDEKPSDILTADGCLSGRLPAIVATRDHPGGWNRAAPRVLVGFSLPDVVALRTLGLECILGTGLEHLARESLAQLAATCGWHAPRRSGVKVIAGKPVRLIFVNWSPAALSRVSPSEKLASVRHHFRGVQIYLRYEIAHTDVWTPSESDLRAISFNLRYGDRDSVRQTIETSLRSSSVVPMPLEHDERDVKPNPLSVSAATRELYRCAAEQPETLAHAWSQAMAALEREAIAPCVESALKKPDASERNHGLAAAGLYRAIHSRILLMETRFHAGIREKGPRRCDMGPLVELQQLAQLLERLAPGAGSASQSANRRPARRMRYSV